MSVWQSMLATCVCVRACVSMYVCIYVCMYVCMYVFVGWYMCKRVQKTCNRGLGTYFEACTKYSTMFTNMLNIKMRSAITYGGGLDSHAQFFVENMHIRLIHWEIKECILITCGGGFGIRAALKSTVSICNATCIYIGVINICINVYMYICVCI